MWTDAASHQATSLVEAFKEVPDPRVNRTLLHPLENILFISLLGVLSGAEGWDDLALFGKTHKAFLGRFLQMPEGTPSADTFRRVFEALDPAGFEKAFRAWLEPLLGDLEGETIALDGKTLRGALARSKSKGGGAFHLMHAWAVDRRILLGQKAVAGAPNEAAAAVELLGLLHIQGATVTADAANCTQAVAAAALNAGADYVLALKGNRPALHDFAKKRFEEAERQGYAGVSTSDTQEKSHGRAEYRIVRAMALGTLPKSIRIAWEGARTLVQVDRVRYADHLSVSRTYYITSHRASATMLAKRIRDHWKIENQLHHCLDVTFGEDRRGIRKKNGAQNFALIHRYAVSILKRDPVKMSVAMKKRKAAWSQSYFIEVLANGFPQI